jgi:hypothetical protein
MNEKLVRTKSVLKCSHCRIHRNVAAPFYSEEEDNPYPSVYFESDNRRQGGANNSGSNNGSLKRTAVGTITAGRRLEEGTQQLRYTSNHDCNRNMLLLRINVSFTV